VVVWLSYRSERDRCRICTSTLLNMTTPHVVKRDSRFYQVEARHFPQAQPHIIKVQGDDESISLNRLVKTTRLPRTQIKHRIDNPKSWPSSRSKPEDASEGARPTGWTLSPQRDASKFRKRMVSLRFVSTVAIASLGLARPLLAGSSLI
jgi:hypothetical protein